MTKDAVPVAAPFRGHTCRELYKAIFEAESPEQLVRQLPAQGLFMVVKQVGLSSCADILMMATLEQCRLLTDLDLWHGSEINEEALWEWLAVTDETDSLELLQKFIKFVDLKILAVLFARNIDVQIFEEKTEQAPGPGYHTPDQGFTWVGIKTEDADRHFLLARLLALIFESSAELFYQLLATPSVATVSMLEEESFQERTKRLAAEGVPEPEAAAAMHAAYSYVEVRRDLQERIKAPVVEDIRSIEPLLYETRASKLFADLMRRITDHEHFEMEFTYLMNGAVVRWGVDFSEQDQVILLADKVKGAINLALERLVKDSKLSTLEIYDSLGMEKLYRYGITELVSLRSAAFRISTDTIEKLKDEHVTFSVIACARQPLPDMPLFLNDDGSVTEQFGELPMGQRAVETFTALQTLRQILDKVNG